MFTVYSAEFAVRTKAKGTYEVTDKVAELARVSQVQTGLVNVFLRHTSASLLIFENADSSARRDLEKFFERLVPEGAGYFSHTMEGPDDMPAHVKSMVNGVCLHVPVAGGKMALGTWQGIYVAEHRARAHRREVSLQFLGCCDRP